MNHKVIRIFLLLSIVIICAGSSLPFFESVAIGRQLTKPKLVLPKTTVYSGKMRPKLLLSTVETGCVIYYRMNAEDKFARYVKPIILENDDDYGFTMEAYTKKWIASIALYYP
jgi:hypothetical protein